MAKLYGIDVSSNQPKGIVRQVDNDFAIVKVSGNPHGYDWNYVNPRAKQQAADAMSKHGRLGLYHFTYGLANPCTEADYFVRQVKSLGYLGKAMLVIDYEADALDMGRDWVRRFAERVEKQAGYKPVIYASGSVIVEQRLSTLGYPLWCANYSKRYHHVDGYDTSGCEIYDGCEKSILWQYTSQGYLDGYDGALDCNVFFGGAKDWQKYTKASSTGKSGTADDVVRIAKAEIGETDGTKYGRWYEKYVDKDSANYDFGAQSVPWCAMFVSWVFNKAKASCAGIPGAYCPSMVVAAKSAGKLVDKQSAKKGDVVYFDWDCDGVADHVGIVTANRGSYLRTVEGNTGNDISGSIVAEQTRYFSTICAVARPNYSGGQSEDPQPQRELEFRLSIDPLGIDWLPINKKARKRKAIRWIAIKGAGRYRVCTIRSGWLPWVGGYDITDLVEGCAGDGSPIVGIEIPSSIVRYAVRVRVGSNSVWYDDMVGTTDTGGTGDNFAGDLANKVDGFRAELV